MATPQTLTTTRKKVAVKLDPVEPNLFADIAFEAARNCIGERDKNKPAQLRKFYDELVMWHDKVHFAQTPEAKNDKFREASPFIQMLRAKAAYARGRGLVDDAFFNLFDDLVSQIKTPETLRTAKFFFEAFLGYKKYFEPSK